MELQSKELFEAVRKEYPEFSAAEAIAFVHAEYLAQIAKGMKTTECSEGECNKRFMESAFGGLS